MCIGMSMFMRGYECVCARMHTSERVHMSELVRTCMCMSVHACRYVSLRIRECSAYMCTSVCKYAYV